uniref:ATP-dependent clp protease n=1 Tax=Solanum tuberosum TaxID=4113 RepID=M0ZXB6_SOLTU
MAVQALSTVAATSKSINQLNCRGPDSFLWTKNPLEPKNLQCQWLGTPIKFSLQSKNFKQFLSKQCTIRADVSFVLPRGKPEPTVPIEKIPKWSAKAVKSFTMAELEARKLKYATTGTEALILGMLIEGTNFASKYLRANSITLLKFREETIKIVGKGDFYYCSPKEPPLTEDAQKALDWAFDEKLKSGVDYGCQKEQIANLTHNAEQLSLRNSDPNNGASEIKSETVERAAIPNLGSSDIKAVAADASAFSFGDDEGYECERVGPFSDSREITTTHVLLGVWSQQGSPGYKVLAALGFNDEKAKELENVISDPGFVDD